MPALGKHGIRTCRTHGNSSLRTHKEPHQKAHEEEKQKKSGRNKKVSNGKSKGVIHNTAVGGSKGNCISQSLSGIGPDQLTIVEGRSIQTIFMKAITENPT